MLRMTDMLRTETPRPLKGDPVFTDFNHICPDPVVIEATQVAQMFMEMTINDLSTKTDEQKEQILDFEDALGAGFGWQVANFFQFDFSSLGTVAPPFDNFVIEFDAREAMDKALSARGQKVDPRKNVHVGKMATSFTVIQREEWLREAGVSERYRDSSWASKRSLDELEALPFRWMVTALTFRYDPGKGLVGPCSTWVIPLGEDGKLFVDEAAGNDAPLLHAMGLGPQPLPWETNDDSGHYMAATGWTILLPSLLAISLMHTPRTTDKREGYHDLYDSPEPNARIARKYLERNFVPLVKWHVLDISPLRRAITEANGGDTPSGLESLNQALHIVRGHTATYMPNTYFGRKHDKPITVFKPSYKRGDAKNGVTMKDYNVVCG